MRQLRECANTRRFRSCQGVRDEGFPTDPAAAEMLVVRRARGEADCALAAAGARMNQNILNVALGTRIELAFTNRP